MLQFSLGYNTLRRYRATVISVIHLHRVLTGKGRYEREKHHVMINPVSRQRDRYVLSKRITYAIFSHEIN